MSSIRPLSSDDMIRSEIKSSFILGDTEGIFLIEDFISLLLLLFFFAEQQITCRAYVLVVPLVGLIIFRWHILLTKSARRACGRDQ